MMKAALALAAGTGFLATLSANAMVCNTPQPPNLDVDGASLSVDAYDALTMDMARYDRERADYVRCLNAVVLQEVETTPEAIDRARVQRGQLYVKDPVTGDYSDPTADRYFDVTQAFLDGQQKRAAEAALQETQASESQLATKMLEAQTQ